jgi:hypothetical protein
MLHPLLKIPTDEISENLNLRSATSFIGLGQLHSFSLLCLHDILYFFIYLRFEISRLEPIIQNSTTFNGLVVYVGLRNGHGMDTPAAADFPAIPWDAI